MKTFISKTYETTPFLAVNGVQLKNDKIGFADHIFFLCRALNHETCTAFVTKFVRLEAIAKAQK